MQVAAMMQEQHAQMASVMQAMQQQTADLAKQIAGMEVRGGDVTVDMPPRATSFRIEYDELGQPERLIPEYTTQH